MSTILSTISPGLAESFSPDKTYHVGNVVLYRNKYWVCNYDRTSGPWSDSRWIEYPEFVKLLEKRLDEKRDKEDLLTQWEVKGEGVYISPVWDRVNNRWVLENYAGDTLYSSAGKYATEATFIGVKSGATVQAVRKRILTEDNITDNITSTSEGAASAAKVAELLDAKVSKLGDTMSGNLTVAGGTIRAGSAEQGAVSTQNDCSISSDGTITVRERNSTSPFTPKVKKEISVLDLATAADVPDIAGISRVEKVDDYLYEVDCTELQYDFAEDYFKRNFPKYVPGACSCLRIGNEFGRAYDWKYDESVSFLVRTCGSSRAFASISVCRSPDGLTKDKAATRSPDCSDLWKAMPFMALDGVNEHGVVCNVNVVSADDSKTAGWTGSEFCGVTAVRHVLDRARTAYEGANLIKSGAWMPKEMGGYSLHFMVADKEHTYIVEDGEIIDVSANEVKAMTNFRMSGEFLTSGKADPKKIVKYDRYGSGVERYNDILDYLADAEKPSLRTWLTGFKYSTAYATAETTRPTDFAGMVLPSGTKAEVDDEAYIQKWFVDEGINDKWKSRTRNGAFWQTVHSSVYDIADKKVSLVIQEGTVVHDFGLVRTDLPDDYETVRDNAEKGATHSEDTAPHVSDSDRESWNAKRDKTDMDAPAMEPANEHWTWKKYSSNCPDDFIAAANAYGASKPMYSATNKRWVCGNIAGYQYVLDYSGTTEASTSIRFQFANGLTSTSLFFDVVAERSSATDTTPVVCHPDISGKVIFAGNLATSEDLKKKRDLSDLAYVRPNPLAKTWDFSAWSAKIPGYDFSQLVLKGYKPTLSYMYRPTFYEGDTPVIIDDRSFVTKAEAARVTDFTASNLSTLDTRFLSLRGTKVSMHPDTVDDNIALVSDVDVAVSGKQDALTGTQLANIDAVPNKLTKTEGVLEEGSFGLSNGAGVEGFFVRKDAGIYIGTPTGIIEIPGGTGGDTMAVLSDVVDATKLTPVFSEWTFSGVDAKRFEHLSCKEVRLDDPLYSDYYLYDGDKEIGLCNLSAPNRKFVYGFRYEDEEGAPKDWDITATRSLIGYKLGDKTTPTLMSTDGPKYDSATGTVRIFIEE